MPWQMGWYSPTEIVQSLRCEYQHRPDPADKRTAITASPQGNTIRSRLCRVASQPQGLHGNLLDSNNWRQRVTCFAPLFLRVRLALRVSTSGQPLTLIQSLLCATGAVVNLAGRGNFRFELTGISNKMDRSGWARARFVTVGKGNPYAVAVRPHLAFTPPGAA